MRRVSLCATVGLLALSAPATGQLSPSASGFSDAPVQADKTAYWLMMNEMGACVAANKNEQARQFVASTIDSAAESAAFDALFHPRRNPCLRNTIFAGMLRSHARGVVAEGLFERLPDEHLAAAVTSGASKQDSIVTLHDFARCYALANPGKASDLLRRTRVATRGETEFVRSMSGEFAPCLPAGREVTLQPTSVRFALAEALYRLATGAPAATIEKAI